MRRFWIACSFAALLAATPAQAQKICRDGTTSNATGRGACSHHGGVAKQADATPTLGNSESVASPTRPSLRATTRASERDPATSRELYPVSKTPRLGSFWNSEVGDGITTAVQSGV